MKRQHILLSLLVTLFALGASAAERTINITKPYTTVAAVAGVKVNYVPGSKNTTVEISGPSDQIDRIVAEVDNGMLCMRPSTDKDGNVRGETVKDVIVTLRGPLVADFTVSAGAKIKTKTPVKYTKKTLMLSASSGAGIEFENVTAQQVNISASSGADIEVDKLKATSAIVSCSSGADVDLEGLDVRQLVASSSSGADVSLKGYAANADLSASSAASLSAKELRTDNRNVSSSSMGSVKVR